ncbi:hypothetical protein F5144DRAFT_591299 [Chaetomium tenue]|uniref:Uncharacterized protein n=1 Tax=Chaetomium tenue TaxID=1854479 RepID=A0ACB7PCG5_9PEZI|nr:hypothetical protein F5144DRAFT_591299 [Chaetomium globosum]
MTKAASEPRALAREVVASLRNGVTRQLGGLTSVSDCRPGSPSAKVPMTLHDDPHCVLTTADSRAPSSTELPGDRYVPASINHMRAAGGCALRFVLPMAVKSRDQSTSQMTLSPSPSETQPRHIRQNFPRGLLPE